MKTIKLTRGHVAIVDDHWFNFLNKFKWSSNGKYAVRVVWIDGKAKTIYMHREIAGPSHKQATDHINMNGFDNREANLRACTYAQNAFNKPKPCNNKSGYKGVSWDAKKKRWRADIKYPDRKRQTTIGYFKSKESAARAWDLAAKELHGEFARLNFSGESAND